MPRMGEPVQADVSYSMMWPAAGWPDRGTHPKLVCVKLGKLGNRREVEGEMRAHGDKGKTALKNSYQCAESELPPATRPR